YMTDSDPEEDPEEDLEEDPEEDPEEDLEDDQADYPTDEGDGDDEPFDGNEDDTDDEDPEEEPFEENDEEEEEHPAPADSPMAALLSPPLPIPSLPLPLPSPLTTKPTDTGAPLGYRAAGIRMRALLSSTSPRTDTGAARQPGPTESDLRRCRVEQEGYKITDTWDEIRTDEFEVRFEDAQFDRALLRARVNTLYRDRPDHRRTAMLMDREAMYSREAWAFSMDRSSAIAGHVMTLETQVAALITQTTSL
nr:hypothetical protein [Tanacetum cinerariifolium]